MFSTIDIYAHRRDPDYDYHTFDAKVEFAVESKCSVLELLGDDSCGHGTSRDGVEREGELSGDELGNWIAVRIICRLLTEALGGHADGK